MNEFLRDASDVLCQICGLVDTLLLIRTTTGMGVYTQPEFQLQLNRLHATKTLEAAREVVVDMLETCLSRLKEKSS